MNINNLNQNFMQKVISFFVAVFFSTMFLSCSQAQTNSNSTTSSDPFHKTE